MAVSFEKKIRSNTKSIIAKNGSAFFVCKKEVLLRGKGEMGENATGRWQRIMWQNVWNLTVMENTGRIFKAQKKQ